MRRGIVFLWFFAPAVAAEAAEFIPVIRLDFYGGQIFFQTQAPSIAASGDWLFSPAVRLSDRDTLIPSLSGAYRRTREVKEYIGGGFIVDETVDNMAALKWVHHVDEAYAVKPSASYKSQLVSETDDEKLGNGLFDHNKFSFGVEIERRGETLVSLRHSFTAFGVRYYNFKALTADRFGDEILSGHNVLDFNSYDYSVEAKIQAGEKILLTASGLGSYRDFVDQRIVTRSGTFSEKNRKDLYVSMVLTAERLLPALGSDWYLLEPAAGFSGGWDQLGSNQNHYDAPRLRFEGDYYDYKEILAGAFFKLLFGRKSAVSAGYDYVRRFYKVRAALNAEGVALVDRAFNNTHQFTYEFSRPIYAGFSLKARGAHRLESSNDKYERSYRSNFHSAHYFIGLGWAY